MVLQFIQVAKNKQSLQLRDLLLDGADPNQRDENGESALNWAAQLGHTPIVKDLLAAGADVENRGNLFGAPPLILAARGGFRGIVALLAVHADVDAQDQKGATALMRAIERPDSLIKPLRKVNSIVKTLLNLGASPDVRDGEGYTALMWAVHWGNQEAIRMLANHGADINIKNNAGESALSIADGNGDTDMVEFLCELGAEN